MEILEEVSHNLLILREQYWMDKLQPWFNLCPIAGSSKGRVCTQEHRANLSKAHIGKKHSVEARSKMSASHKGTKKPWARGKGKLTIGQVLKIRDELSIKSCAQLAKEYGVKSSAISKIKQGRTWNTLSLS